MHMRLAGLCLIACLAPAFPAAAQTAAELYEEGVTARREQRFEDAVAVLQRAAELEPGNADVHVQLGFALSAMGNGSEAQAAFARALDIAPGYQDARFGLAQIAFRSGNADEARQLVEVVLQAQPDNAEAVALLSSIERAEMARADAATARGPAQAPREPAPPAPAQVPEGRQQAALNAAMPKKWRLDIGSEFSDLTGARPSWSDSSIALAYRIDSRSTITGRTRLATRFGRTDVQIEARLDQAFGSGLSAYGLLAATPDADFLAEFSIGGGASWRAIKGSNSWGALALTVDLRHDVYAGNDVTTVSPGVQVFLMDERLGISARWVHSRDNAGTAANGYVLRGDVVATDRLRFFAGYGDAPEISEGALVQARSMFTGMSFDLTDSVTVNASYAREERDAFDRKTLGLGLSVRF